MIDAVMDIFDKNWIDDRWEDVEPEQYFYITQDIDKKIEADKIYYNKLSDFQREFKISEETIRTIKEQFKNNDTLLDIVEPYVDYFLEVSGVFVFNYKSYGTKTIASLIFDDDKLPDNLHDLIIEELKNLRTSDNLIFYHRIEPVFTLNTEEIRAAIKIIGNVIVKKPTF
jgi:hypothetical protein